MKRLLSIMVLAALAAIVIINCSGRSSSGKVLVDVNGNTITEGDLEFLGDINPRIRAQITNPAGRKRILDNLVEQDLLYQQAVKEGVNRNPDVKAKVDLYRRVIIAQSLIDQEVDEAAKKYYKENQDNFKKLKLSHVMVKYGSPEEIKKARKRKKKLLSEKDALKKAKELKGKIDSGATFADVAKANSDDIATKARGGDLGLASKDDRRLSARGYGPLLEKAYTMKVGEVSEPIKTSKGYHIVTVTRGIELEPYDEAKNSILFKVRNDTRQDLVAKLKKDSKITYPEEEKRKEAAKKATPKPKEPAKNETKEKKKKLKIKKIEEVKKGKETKAPEKKK